MKTDSENGVKSAGLWLIRSHGIAPQDPNCFVYHAAWLHGFCEALPSLGKASNIFTGGAQSAGVELQAVSQKAVDLQTWLCRVYPPCLYPDLLHQR